MILLFYQEMKKKSITYVRFPDIIELEYVKLTKAKYGQLDMIPCCFARMNSQVLK